MTRNPLNHFALHPVTPYVRLGLALLAPVLIVTLAVACGGQPSGGAPSGPTAEPTRPQAPASLNAPVPRVTPMAGNLGTSASPSPAAAGSPSPSPSPAR